MVKNMNLVPIVYTSLVLFFGFLLIVVTISYFTFKTKSKVNPLIEAEIKNQQKKLVVIRQNQYLAPQSSIQVQNISNTLPSYSYQPVPELNRQVRILQSDDFNGMRKNYESITRNKQEEKFTTKYQPENRKETYTNSVRDKRGSNRIEIMNRSSNFYTNENNFSRRETKSFNVPQAEYNMFNFYSDIPETGLSSITAASNRAV